MSSSGEITRLLIGAQAGASGAQDALFQAVYQQLREMARHRVPRGRRDPSLDSTALVHEAYLKLVDRSQAIWNDRTHFFSVAALAMRQIVVDYARKRRAAKHGGDAVDVSLHESQIRIEDSQVDMLALDEALSRLEELNPRLCRVVELRFFAGLSVEETAAVLKVTPRTIKRDWRMARAFLYEELNDA